VLCSRLPVAVMGFWLACPLVLVQVWDGCVQCVRG